MLLLPVITSIQTLKARLATFFETSHFNQLTNYVTITIEIDWNKKNEVPKEFKSQFYNTHS